jgi:hypothetical protein
MAVIDPEHAPAGPLKESRRSHANTAWGAYGMEGWRANHRADFSKRDSTRSTSRAQERPDCCVMPGDSGPAKPYNIPPNQAECRFLAGPGPNPAARHAPCPTPTPEIVGYLRVASRALGAAGYSPCAGSRTGPRRSNRGRGQSAAEAPRAGCVRARFRGAEREFREPAGGCCPGSSGQSEYPTPSVCLRAPSNGIASTPRPAPSVRSRSMSVVRPSTHSRRRALSSGSHPRRSFTARTRSQAMRSSASSLSVCSGRM